MTAKVILNPYAARGVALKRRPEAEAALQNNGIEYDFQVSEYVGHGIKLAKQAVESGFNPIIAAGGDSTYNEIVNGILQASTDSGSSPAFGILPMGTANDLPTNLGLPLNLNEAAAIIAAGNTRLMDVCQMNDRFFVNNSAVGLETAISVIQANMKRVHGIFRYLLATLVGIARNPQWHMEISWDDGSYSGPATLVSVGNNPLTGGLFYTVPHANPFDGKLSFIHGSVKTRLAILRLLPSMFKSGEGNISEHPAVHEYHCTWLKIETDPSTPVHTDGEIISLAIQSLEYRVHPARIPVLLST